MPASPSPEAPDFCSAAPPSSFALTQEVADALYAAAEAKEEALLAAQENLERATHAMDMLVEAGVLPEKGLPAVSGYTI